MCLVYFPCIFAQSIICILFKAIDYANSEKYYVANSILLPGCCRWGIPQIIYPLPFQRSQRLCLWVGLHLSMSFGSLPLHINWSTKLTTKSSCLKYENCQVFESWDEHCRSARNFALLCLPLPLPPDHLHHHGPDKVPGRDEEDRPDFQNHEKFEVRRKNYGK